MCATLSWARAMIVLVCVHLVYALEGVSENPTDQQPSFKELPGAIPGWEDVELFRHPGRNREVRILANLLAALNPSAVFIASYPVMYLVMGHGAGCRIAAPEKSPRNHMHSTVQRRDSPLMSTYREPTMLVKVSRTWSTIREEADDLWRFVRHPTPGPRLPGRYPGSRIRSDFFSSLHLWRRLIMWPLLLSASDTAFFYLMSYVSSLVPSLGIKDVWTSNRVLMVKNYPYILAVFLGPLMEELKFRYHLRYLPPVWLLPLSWFTIQGTYALLLLVPPFPREIECLGLTPRHFSEVLSELTGQMKKLILITYFLRSVTRKPAGEERDFVRHFRERGRTFFHHHYRIAVYLSSLVFALAHLSNFNLPPHLWQIPIVTMPHLSGGLFLSWLRVRCGIGASIVAHMVINSVPAVWHIWHNFFD